MPKLAIPLAHGASHATAGSDPVYANQGHLGGGRLETFVRINATVDSALLASGSVYFSHLTPDTTTTITKILAISGSSPASATTLCRMGLYLAAANGDLTLVAQTANLLTGATNESSGAGGLLLFASGNLLYSGPLDASIVTSYTMQRGQRYAGAIIFVGGTLPKVKGTGPGASGVMNIAPRGGGLLAGQTDLPPTVTAAVLGPTGLIWPWMGFSS